MAAPKEWIEFSHANWDAVIARAEQLVAARKGWINLSPEVEDEERVARRGSSPVGLGSVFRTLGPTVPLATWVLRTDREPGTVGIQHDVRSRVLPRLLEAGIQPPDQSFRVQDSPRRGLVLRLPDPVDVAEVLEFMMRAVDELCPLQLTGNWLAELHPG